MNATSFQHSGAPVVGGLCALVALLVVFGSVALGQGGGPAAGRVRIKRGPVAIVAGPGRIDADAARTFTATKLGDFRRCHKVGTRDVLRPEGEVELLVTIGPAGRVTRAKVDRNQLTPALGRCLVARFKTYRFPAPDGGAVTLRFPFEFVLARKLGR